MNKREQIIYEADYIIYGKHTISEAADELSKVLGKSISKRTIQIHMNEKLKRIDPKKYLQIKDSVKITAKERMSKGGRNGKRQTNYSKTLILAIANEIINGYENGEKITLQMMSEKYNIPQSTLYELLHNKSILDDATINILKVTAKANKSKKGNKNEK